MAASGMWAVFEEPAGFRHRTGERSEPLPTAGRPGPLRIHPGYRRPFLHRPPAQGDVCVRTQYARTAPEYLPEGHGVHPVHVRPGIQQPVGELRAGGEVRLRKEIVCHSISYCGM